MPIKVSRLVLSISLIGLLLLVIPHSFIAAYPEEGQVTIVFDMSHDQPLSQTNRNFTYAINFFLNHSEYSIRVLETELTANNLSRAHVLVIPNPGRNFTSAELDVVSDFVSSGGGLFLLGDYQTAERPIGSPQALNQILEAINENRIRFTTSQEDKKTTGDAIIDYEHDLILPYNILINEILSTGDSRELIGINVGQVILAGGSLTADGMGFIVSTGTNTSNAVTPKGHIIQNQPSWLAAYWIGMARIVLCTSTTMFSNTICLGTNQSWFQSADNSLLWYNIFKWFSRDLIHDPTPIMVVFVALAFITSITLFIYSLWLKKRGR